MYPSHDSTSDIYAEPNPVSNLKECYFYHTMDVPGYGRVEGQWDLRPGAGNYYGNLDFNGKRVLEIGTSSGFGCFTMEKWGAEVVAFDLSPKYSWDVVPFHNIDYRLHMEKMKDGYRRQNNGFWLCHRAYNSKARMAYGTVYGIPEEIGKVDVATFCAVLLHLRDPFLALQSASKLVEETIIVTDVIPEHIVAKRPSQIIFRPALAIGSETEKSLTTWWYLPPETIVDFLKILGFGKCEISFHRQLWRKEITGENFIELPFYTVVGQRINNVL